MTTRFAGDFFGVALVPEENEKSSLVKYFPDLADIKKAKRPAGDTSGARSFGGAKAITPFIGFKTFEKADGGEVQAAPTFTGFKPQDFTR